MIRKLNLSLDAYVLFDIDGTLVRSKNNGQSPIALACAEVFGIHSLPDIELGGRTDFAIFREMFERLNLNFETDRLAFESSYYSHLETHWSSGHFEKLPKTDELLLALKESCFRLGLLTGNSEQAARIKLAAANQLNHFEFGGYGRDTECRNELAISVVRERHKLNPSSVSESKWIVVGDTPADIACARAIGANVVAVATGCFTMQELAVFKPDFLLSDFNDTALVLAKIRQLMADSPPQTTQRSKPS